MNWGNRIVLVFVLFAAFIGYMVVRAFQEDFDLVSEDYYAQEINYQNKLNRMKNTENNDFSVLVNQKAEEVTLNFPGPATGEIHFYHPSRKIFDRKFNIALSDNNIQVIKKSDLIPGSYRININCKVDGKEYFQQTSIFLQ